MMAVEIECMSEPSTALAPPPAAPPRERPLLRIVAVAAALVVGVAVAVFAAVVALVAVLAALVAVLLRRRRELRGSATLEGRRTPEGWVAEAASR
jgi:uncharacterized membrane protein